MTTKTTTSGLRVIGAGMARTGTASLQLALQQLGFDPCHHMREVVHHPEEVPTWEAAARGEPIDWNSFMAGWAASVDLPSALYYRELMAAFPEAKVILSVRSPESWYASMGKTIIPAIKRFPNSLIVPHLPRVSGPSRVTANTVFREQVVERFADKQHVLATFEQWNEEVQRTVPAERLLVFEAKQGWEPLCAFLGVPVPDYPYPHTNDSAQFQRGVRIATAISWAILLIPLALALVALAWWLGSTATGPMVARGVSLLVP